MISAALHISDKKWKLMNNEHRSLYNVIIELTEGRCIMFELSLVEQLKNLTKFKRLAA